MNTYPKLFSPIKIGETTVKNRVFMPPISTNLADKGYVTDALVEHYAARAKAGKLTKALYTATSEYVKEIKFLPVKRQVSVSGILKKLGVSRSGYNAWKKRVPSDTSVRRAES